MSKVEICQFEDVLPIWEKELWPSRQSKVEAHSAIGPSGKIEMLWFEQSQAFFWSLRKDDLVVGVQSLLVLGDAARLRGLWVRGSCRGQGLSKLLIATALEEARKHHCRLVWTLARKDSAPVYIKHGFELKKQIFEYEFGPHHLLQKSF